MKERHTKNTSWESVQKWYHGSVGEEGHYYHKNIILPGLLRVMELKPGNSVLDLGSGQGVLARSLPKDLDYVGIDFSPSLIKLAKQNERNPKHTYIVADVTKKLPIDKSDFSHAVFLLSLQNMSAPEQALKTASSHLKPNGKLFIVLNHPCFRIPRQSSWQVDQEKKLQYRRIDRYGSSLKIPIQAEPSKGQKSATTWSFHHPISSYSLWLKNSGFAIILMEEWFSDKVSTGSAAKMENRSRSEFPLFLTMVCQKIN